MRARRMRRDWTKARVLIWMEEGEGEEEDMCLGV
jgi:hypothetical protein